MSAAPTHTFPLSTLSLTGKIVLALAAVLTAALCFQMWPEWSHNPDLSHGLFAPVLFLILLHESRQRGPWRYFAESKTLKAFRGAALVGGLGLVVIAGLYAAAIDWSHALVGLSLTLALSALLLAALLWFASDKIRQLPFNWTSFVALAIWPLCSPIPPGTYSRLTLQLQFWVTDIVLESLHLLGVAASTSGNIIILAHTSVGVEEACSGVRSLLSCVVAALFFSATLVRKPWARIFLIALAPPLAFGMNIVRSLGLTLMANSGVDIGGKWHDLTGFAVLGVTALILGALAFWLEDRPPVTGSGAEQKAAANSSTTGTAADAAAVDDGATDDAAHTNFTRAAARPFGLLTVYSLAAALIVFFALNTHGSARVKEPIPDLAAILPVAPTGWDAVRTEDLFRFSDVLETQHLIQRTYARRQRLPGVEEPLQITVYMAYWPAGAVPVSLVASHTPDACWPGGGWVAQPITPAPVPFKAGERTLPTPEFRRFTQAGFLQNIWYWHLYDGRSITQADPRSPAALLKLAWNYGFRTAGDQMFVRFSSNRPWDEIKDEPLVIEIVKGLQTHGL